MRTAILVVAGALPASYFALLLLFRLLRNHLLKKNIGACNLHLLRTGRRPEQKIDGAAVICGGSIAGLLAARVCHEHFARVLVIEAEPWVASEEGRKVDGWNLTRQRTRVLQYNSLHSCQPFLFAGLRQLFPNILEECERSRIKVLPWFQRYNISGVLWRAPLSALKSGLPKSMFTSRWGFETFIRRLVLNRSSYPNIEFITGTVTDVVPDPVDPSRLSKVVMRTDSSGAGAVQEIPAALVIDCTGPARAGLKWLARHGYGNSASYPRGKLPLDQLKISLDQKLRYSSITFRVTPAFLERLRGVLPEDLKDDKPIITFLEDRTDKTIVNGRGFFVIMRKDADQIVAFAGHYGTVRNQPRTIAELREYALSLYAVEPIPEWLFKLLDMLEELGDEAVTVSLVKVPPTTYVRYHLATNLPSNYIALGDSVMTVNPLFGEGSTKALRCALVLQTALLRAQTTSRRTLPPTFAKDFFAEEHDKTGWLWENTRVLDYGALSTEPIPGESLSSGASLRWYITWLQRLATMDDHAALVMHESVCGFASPVDALHPSLVVKVLWRALLGW